jgi:hypothetical protein
MSQSSKKGDFKTGDLGVTSRNMAVVPNSLSEEMGLVGRLVVQKNRVKAIRLRGMVSQGLVYPTKDGKKAKTSKKN